jgi:hypothetical protein
MTAAFVLVTPLASTSWRLYSTVIPRPAIKCMHVALMTTALVLVWLGIADMAALKESVGSAHLVSLHSWVGLAAACLFTLTWAGIYCYNPLGNLTPCHAPSSPPRRGELPLWHTSLGMVALGMGLLAVCTGIMAYQGVQGAAGQSTDALNTAGLLTCAAGAFMSLVFRYYPIHYGPPLTGPRWWRAHRPVPPSLTPSPSCAALGGAV